MINKEQIGKICEYLLQGLKETEACIVSDVDPAEFRELRENNPDVQRIIDKANIKFKLSHLKEIQTKKSERNSMWILEKLIPDEFGSKAKSEGPTINIISQIIKSIQNGDQQSRIEPRTRGELLIERSEEEFDPGSTLK